VDFERRSGSVSEVDVKHPFTYTTREAHSAAGLPSEVCLTSVSVVVIRRIGMVRYPCQTVLRVCNQSLPRSKCSIHWYTTPARATCMSTSLGAPLERLRYVMLQCMIDKSLQK
jgi:hypothetical protein